MSTTPTLRVLLVEDSATDARILETVAERVTRTRFEIRRVATMKDAVHGLREGNVDLVILDLTLPDSPAHQTVERLRSDFPGVPVVVWTAMDDPDLAMEALKAGAQDYLPKGRLDPELFARTARYAVERQRFRGELERSYRELDEFAQIVSHDLKAPLRAINNLAAMIKDDLGPDAAPKVKENLEKMGDRATRLSKMIEGVLSYSRRTRVQEAPSEVSVKDVVDEVVDGLRLPDGFAVQATTPLPSVQADRIRLQEVFQNLIGNAVKHHDRASGVVRVGATDQGAAFEFVVEDDGPGIPAHEQGRLFDLFHPPSVKTSPDSTHVGLAIVKKIVESQGGAIHVEPAQPRGARFRFTWPKLAGGPVPARVTASQS